MVDHIMLDYEEGKSKSMDFKETELRLGLPGGEEKNGVNFGKRGYGETVDLKLNLSSEESDLSHGKEKNLLVPNDPVLKPPAKAQVVGWPPVRSFRKNIMAVQKNNSEDTSVAGGAAVFVKVSMDGAPYLRKVDLKMYKAYQELSEALCKMFGSFTMGKCDSQGMMDFMNESKLMDLLNGSDYVPTYEDKDGDWMLVGDVPWDAQSRGEMQEQKLNSINSTTTCSSDLCVCVVQQGEIKGQAHEIDGAGCWIVSVLLHVWLVVILIL